MGELMAQEAFPCARQPGKEDEPLGAGQPPQVGVELCICRYDETA